MAANTTITLAPKTWTLLTLSDVTAISAQNQGISDTYLMGTVGAVEPTTRDGARALGPMESIATDLTLADVWPGISATRVYAWSNLGGNLAYSYA